MNSNAHFEYVRHKYLINLISWVAVYMFLNIQDEYKKSDALSISLHCHVIDILRV